MGMDYENIDDQYEYGTFFPNVFSLKNNNISNNPTLKEKNKECSKKITESYLSSQSRKSTLDYDTENAKNFILSKKDTDKFKNIFSNPVNSSFFKTKNDLIIYKNEPYYLEVKENEKEDIRKKYFSKLIYKNIWAPGIKSKTHNSLFIFDWDDTLFPTSFLVNGKIYEQNLSEELEKLLSELEVLVINILNFSLSKGDVYIITNSSFTWFSYSSDKYFPNLNNILKKIKIISARDEYEDLYPGKNQLWKEKAFLKLNNNLNKNLVTNIICFGDSLIELEAGKKLASEFSNSFCKTIKFKENPELEDLIKQLNLISAQLNYIYSNPKNLSITIEQKY